MSPLHILVTILIFALIAGVVLYLAKAVIAAFKVEQPFASIAYAAALLIVLIVFLSEIGFFGPPHGWRNWR